MKAYKRSGIIMPLILKLDLNGSELSDAGPGCIYLIVLGALGHGHRQFMSDTTLG